MVLVGLPRSAVARTARKWWRGTGDASGYPCSAAPRIIARASNVPARKSAYHGYPLPYASGTNASSLLLRASGTNARRPCFGRASGRVGVAPVLPCFVHRMTSSMRLDGCAHEVAMSDKPNFVLDDDRARPGTRAAAVVAGRSGEGRPSPCCRRAARRAITTEASHRPRLVFGFDATASREPAWATARQVTDALVRALPGELDVALAVHGGGAPAHLYRLHRRRQPAARPSRRDSCIAGHTRLLPILARSLAAPGVRVVTYIGDVFEEVARRGRKMADELGRMGSSSSSCTTPRLDRPARRGGFPDLARRTGGCVLPFDAGAPVGCVSCCRRRGLCRGWRGDAARKAARDARRCTYRWSTSANNLSRATRGRGRWRAAPG